MALATGMPFDAPAETLNAKTGAWQLTVTTLTSGNPLPADVLAKMPPDERAKVEEAMKARAGKPSTETFKTCITQADLNQNRMIRSEDDDSNCKKKVLSHTSTKHVITQTCPPPRASSGQATIEAKTPESIVASIDTIQADGNGKIRVDIKGRWLGVSCEGIEQ